jgi:signal transduction histidine kinase/DNA-binding response OmpR family regulator
MSEQTDFQFVESASPPVVETAGRTEVEDFPKDVLLGLIAGLGFGVAIVVVLGALGVITWPFALLAVLGIVAVGALNNVFLQKFRGQIRAMSTVLEEKVQEVESRKAREQQVADRLRELNHSLFEAKQAALRASRTKDLFLANISHELRTPLTVIIGYAEILIDEATEADRLGDLDLFQHIHASARHLLTLINDILDLSKIESGKVELVPEWVDVRTLVESINGDVSKLAATRGDRLEVEIGRRADMMWTDATRLRQILLNIAHNAVKFTENGVVRIEVERRFQAGKDRTTFKVSDTGIGMTPEQKQKLFQEFVQADAEISRKYGGTGLGLAIVHRTVHLMGGSIYVDSEIGVGTTFVVVLPTEVDSRGEKPARPMRPRSREDRNVVVVIDDDRVMRDDMVRFVGETGYVAVSAWSGDEGLRLARDLGAAAIALDVGLPGKDGWTVLAEIRRDAELMSTPVLLISRHGKNPGLVAVEQYLTKPINSADLKLATSTYAEIGRSRPAVIVCDDEPTRAVIEDALLEQGWRLAVIARGVKTSINLDEEPGIVVVDLMMPELAGFAMLRRFAERHPDAPIVALFSEALTPEDVFLLHKGVEQAVRTDGEFHEQVRQALERQVGPALNG